MLDEVVGLLAKAAEQRSSYVRLADRAARLYAPVVHLAALATFLGWLALGAGWQHALVVAITVLIITCPCALGARGAGGAGCRRRRPVPPRAILNSGEALERLAEADTVVFDKTGTLTQPAPDARQRRRHRAEDLALAGSLALVEPASARQGDREAAAGAREPMAAQEFPGAGRERACIVGSA